MLTTKPGRSTRSLTSKLQLLSCLLVCMACISCANKPTTEEDKPATLDPGDETKQSKTESKVEELKLGPNEVLRHAVFFKFKAESSEEEIKEVVDAFRALPSKVPEIIDFHWGENNSPEGKNDEFTHCFLLTFADDAGRKIYSPHAEHKAFGNVLRPHMAGLFVIDYVGNKDENAPEKALKHAVFFKFKDDASDEAIKKVEEEFAALPSKIDTIKAFEWGRNNSPEKNDDGFTHCFMVTFDSEEGRAAYLPHEDHMAFVKILKPSLDKARVLDFWAQK